MKIVSLSWFLPRLGGKPIHNIQYIEHMWAFETGP